MSRCRSCQMTTTHSNSSNTAHSPRNITYIQNTDQSTPSYIVVARPWSTILWRHLKEYIGIIVPIFMMIIWTWTDDDLLRESARVILINVLLFLWRCMLYDAKMTHCRRRDRCFPSPGWRPSDQLPSPWRPEWRPPSTSLAINEASRQRGLYFYCLQKKNNHNN